ncbi:MAG TPA: TauD/TfdA family dioxygenase [Burkholderiales bacterium]|nr:TauD/TfdA family dioxygenase [Burkholderiales bacterium]
MLDIRPLHPLFGAEIRGIAVSGQVDDAVFAEIRGAFERYSLLVLRGQDITDDQQLAFSRRFGPLETTKVGTVGEGTELVFLTNIGPDGAIVPETHRQWLNTRANQLWHSDSSFKRVPALASLLSGREVPHRGGETQFVGMRAVWRELPEAQKRRVEGRVAVHDYAYSRGKIDPHLATEPERRALPPVRQTMVRVHPLTGEKGLYIGSHACGIEGMAQEDGRALIAELLDFATQPRFVHTHRWQRHDLLIWDNRFVIHRGRPFPSNRRRYLVRTTVAGDAPTAPQYAADEGRETRAEDPARVER